MCRNVRRVRYIVSPRVQVSKRVHRLFYLSLCFLFPPTYVGNGGGSNRDEANCVSSCHSHCCCYSLSWQTWSWLWLCHTPPLCNPTCVPCSPTLCSHHGAYPVDRLGFGAAAPCTCGSSPRHLRPLLRLRGVLGGVRGVRCKRGKGGRRGG